jgi:hypothetical protein
LRRADVQRLAALGLLSAGAESAADERSLVELCAEGRLEGGLSVATDVRPDELLGPLCQRIGARSFSVLDVRISPPELWVQVGESKLRWAVPDVEALVRALNRAYRREPDVRAIAQLGEKDEARQLWCIPKGTLPALLGEGLLRAENQEELSALLAPEEAT